jgi:hypothetical protein
MGGVQRNDESGNILETLAAPLDKTTVVLGSLVVERKSNRRAGCGAFHFSLSPSVEHLQLMMTLEGSFAGSRCPSQHFSLHIGSMPAHHEDECIHFSTSEMMSCCLQSVFHDHRSFRLAERRCLPSLCCEKVAILGKLRSWLTHVDPHGCTAHREK